ncbi:unnamed protein product [Meganyctiphanes norvegica]|uniref:limulus clotting factor C n=1 Tax=Meganyctiphanes norvegica TaxID=48144 RepID=A0AAV2R9Q2_MEGNR
MLPIVRCMILIIALGEVLLNTFALDFDGPYNMIWSQNQCKRLNVIYPCRSVEFCMAKCSRNDACSVLSYHTTMGICQLRECKLPIPKPAYYHPGTIGYVKKLKAQEPTTPPLETTTTELLNFLTQDEITTQEVASCECGALPSSAYKYNRIVGGHEVDPMHKYPWHAGLYSGDNYYFCGATIITTRHVLTAAHCFAIFPNNRPCHIKLPHYLRVGIADHDEADDSDDIPNVTRRISVKNVNVHPQYLCHTYNYDLAMLELEHEMVFGEFLHPVCLPEADTKTYEGEMSVVVGWGDTSNGYNVYPGKLQEVKVPVMDPECGGYEPIKEDMICAGYPKKGGKDACSGDSGGSMTVQENGRYTQVGIVSYGYGCAEPKYPGVYARVTTVLGWIRNITDHSGACTSDLKLL